MRLLHENKQNYLKTVGITLLLEFRKDSAFWQYIICEDIGEDSAPVY